MPTPTYTPLATVTLGSSAASVTFSSIPATYRDLIVVLNVGGTSTAQVRVQYNGDTGSNYSAVRMTGDGSTTSSGSATEASMRLSASLSTAVQTALIHQIMDYSATDKHKSVLNRHSSAATHVEATAGRWASTSALTSISFILSTGSYISGSRFDLYGVIA
jgi:hypothetical protein